MRTLANRNVFLIDTDRECFWKRSRTQKCPRPSRAKRRREVVEHEDAGRPGLPRDAIRAGGGRPGGKRRCRW